MANGRECHVHHGQSLLDQSAEIASQSKRELLWWDNEYRFRK